MTNEPKLREVIGARALRYGYIGIDRDNIVDIALGVLRDAERSVTPSDVSPLELSMELDIDLYEAILADLRANVPEGSINFPMTGTVAYAAAMAAARFYADRARKTIVGENVTEAQGD